MKLLRQYQYSSDAERVADKLRNRGILCHVSSKQSHSLGPYSGVVSVGLWVVLNSQYRDALAVLDNPRHKVENPLAEEEMLELEAYAATRVAKVAERYLYPVLVVLSFALIVFFVYLHKIW